MKKLLTYGKSEADFLAGQVVDEVKWITNGHWLVREQYVNLRPRELRLSIERNGIWTRNNRGTPKAADLKEIIDGVPPEDRIEAMLTDVLIDNLGPYTCRFIVPASGEGFGVMVQEQYVCKALVGLQMRISKNDPDAAAMFFRYDQLQAVLMPIRIQDETLSELNLVVGAMSRAKELSEKLAAERRKEEEALPTVDHDSEGNLE